MSMEVTQERSGDTLVLSPTGRLDSGSSRPFETVVMEQVGGGEKRLVVDFSGLDFISSAGMRVLLMAARALEESGGSLVLCSMKAHVEEVFRISGFDQIIAICESREAALEVAAGGGSGTGRSRLARAGI